MRTRTTKKHQRFFLTILLIGIFSTIFPSSLRAEMVDFQIDGDYFTDLLRNRMIEEAFCPSTVVFEGESYVVDYINFHENAVIRRSAEVEEIEINPFESISTTPTQVVVPVEIGLKTPDCHRSTECGISEYAFVYEAEMVFNILGDFTGAWSWQICTDFVGMDMDVLVLEELEGLGEDLESCFELNLGGIEQILGHGYRDIGTGITLSDSGHLVARIEYIEGPPVAGTELSDLFFEVDPSLWEAFHEGDFTPTFTAEDWGVSLSKTMMINSLVTFFEWAILREFPDAVIADTTTSLVSGESNDRLMIIYTGAIDSGTWYGYVDGHVNITVDFHYTSDSIIINGASELVIDDDFVAPLVDYTLNPWMIGCDNETVPEGTFRCEYAAPHPRFQFGSTFAEPRAEVITNDPVQLMYSGTVSTSISPPPYERADINGFVAYGSHADDCSNIQIGNYGAVHVFGNGGMLCDAPRIRHDPLRFYSLIPDSSDFDLPINYEIRYNENVSDEFFANPYPLIVSFETTRGSQTLDFGTAEVGNFVEHLGDYTWIWGECHAVTIDVPRKVAWPDWVAFDRRIRTLDDLTRRITRFDTVIRTSHPVFDDEVSSVMAWPDYVTQIQNPMVVYENVLGMMPIEDWQFGNRVVLEGEFMTRVEETYQEYASSPGFRRIGR